MIFFDSIILGFYYLLDNTLYLSQKERIYGPREHALFVAWTFYTINVYLIVKLIAKSFGVSAGTNLIFGVAVLVLIFNYIVYFRKGRLEKLLVNYRTGKRKILLVVIALLYSAIMVYLFVRKWHF